MFRYSHFGFEVDSEFRLPLRSGQPERSPDLTLVIGGAAPDLAAYGRLLSVTVPDSEGDLKFSVLRGLGRLMLEVSDVGRFVIEPACITVFPVSRPRRQLLTHFLLTSVWTLWAEHLGMPVLHGAAIRTKSGAGVVLLGDSGAGKSVLAAAFHREGHLVLSDDLVLCIPTSGQWEVGADNGLVRLWPDAAAGVGLSQPAESWEPADTTKAVFRLSALGSRTPLTAIFVVRRGTERRISLQPRLGTAALLPLLEHAYAPRTVSAGIGQARRLVMLAKLVESPGIVEMAYPSGFGHLPEVIRAVDEFGPTLKLSF